MHIKFWSANLKGRDHLENLSIDGGKIILVWILREKGGNVWSGSIWLRTGTSGGPLLTL
jgi:hypothetical protein